MWKIKHEPVSTSIGHVSGISATLWDACSFRPFIVPFTFKEWSIFDAVSEVTLKVEFFSESIGFIASIF
jgi:hypothetical protein